MVRRALVVLMLLLVGSWSAAAQQPLTGPRPVLRVTPTYFSVSGATGTDVASQFAQIANTGNGPLRWTVTAPTVSWLTVSPLSGTNAATLTLAFHTAGLPAGTLIAGFNVVNGTQVVNVTVQVSLVAPPPSPGPTPPPTTTTCGQPGSADCGPQSTITCPVGAISVTPGSNIQSAVTANPAGSVFCLRAGVHPITSDITPKSGDSFIGEFGAILDGSGWARGDIEQAAIKAFSQDIDNVTVRNIECRYMPRSCIEGYGPNGLITGWVVDHNHLHHNYRYGVNNCGNSCQITNNNIHDNIGDPNSSNYADNGGGYGIGRHTDVLLANNVIGPGNGSEQKISDTANVTVRNNWFHHNVYNGLWFDGDNNGCLAVGNTIEDHPVQGLFVEITQNCRILNNTLRRNGWGGIELHTSANIEVGFNRIENSGSTGIQLRQECNRGAEIVNQMRDANVHDNTIIGAPSSFIAGFVLDESISGCADRDDYLNNTTKNNRFLANHYDVPDPAGAYWFWGATGTTTKLTFTQWKAKGLDTTGTAD